MLAPITIACQPQWAMAPSLPERDIANAFGGGRTASYISAVLRYCRGGSLGGSGRGSKNIQCGGQRDFCGGGAPPSLADLHELANRCRQLDCTDVGDLDRPRGRGRLELLRTESR